MLYIKKIIRQKYESLLRSRLVRGAFTLASGAALAQMVNMVFMPVVARIYGPEALGMLGLFTAVIAVITPLAALAYPAAIILPQKNSEAVGLVLLSFFISLGLSFALIVIIIIGDDYIIDIFKLNSISEYLYIIPFVFIFSCVEQISRQWLIRCNEYRKVSISLLGNSVIVNALKLIVGWISPLGKVLIIITTIGYTIHATLLSIAVYRYSKKKISFEVVFSFDFFKKIAINFRDFPLYRAPQNFINAASQSVPVFLLTILFGPVAAGCYALAKSVVEVPVVLVGKAIGDVFYPIITDVARVRGDIDGYIVRATMIMFFVSVIPFGIFFLYSNQIFCFVFGDEWVKSGDYAKWLSMFFLFNFINKPSVSAVPVLGIQRGLLIYEIFSTALKLVGLYFGFYFFDDDVVAIAFFSIFGVTAYIAMIFWIVMSAKRWKYEEAGK